MIMLHTPDLIWLIGLVHWLIFTYKTLSMWILGS